MLGEEPSGISIIDSTPLVSCHIKRMHMHKTMRGWAQKGKCTMGWFYGSWDPEARIRTLWHVLAY